MLVNLTPSDLALLRGLIRDEARRAGYGSQYHNYNHQDNGPRDWPPRLKSLRRVIRKLTP